MDTNQDKLKLTSVNDLMVMNFYIPTYQRGYRWKTRQVTDLLDDIWDFHEKEKKPNEIYCVQPLVVKRKEDDVFRKIKEEASNLYEIINLIKGYWEVIDGQQRLTTVYIILSYLLPSLTDKFNLEYATRNPDNRTDTSSGDVLGSKEFLKKLDRGEIDNNLSSSNIDFYHMYNTYMTVADWVKEKKNELTAANKDSLFDGFVDTITNRVKFIWYETEEPDPIEVFIRLNIGKISLTDSELIKALFLNESNFKDSTGAIRMQQIEIASEWDMIEKTLQDEEFWLFIHDLGWEKPTRIEWIFDMIVKQKLFGEMPDCGDDNHKTFRYFYEYFNQNKKEMTSDWIRSIWNQVKKYFMIFNEWYNDFELYHYVGYLIHEGTSIEQLLKNFQNRKDEFKIYLKNEIRGKIRSCSDLTREYGDNGESKRDCFKLLLLFNIQLVINQNIEYIKDKKYGMGAYYRFPFHLFKKEGKKNNKKGWEVEHIASNSGDNLSDIRNKKVWLASVLYSNSDNKQLKNAIVDYLESDNPTEDEFENLRNNIAKIEVEPLDGIAKQMIWNYAILDSSTNEEYQNNPFPIKRVCILAKESGRKAKKTYDSKTHRVTFDKGEEVIAFVPPGTKSVFIKAYTDMPMSLTSWTRTDAECYLRKIEEVLCEFLYPEIYSLPDKYLIVFFRGNRIIAFLNSQLRNRYIRMVRAKIASSNTGKQ